MNQQDQTHFRTILILVGIYAVGTFTHEALKFFLVDPNFCDFAVFYFLSDLLDQGMNFLNITPDELKVLQANSGIPHICYPEPGVALYSPAFYAVVALLTAFDFHLANLFWFFLNCLALISSILLLMHTFKIEMNIVNFSIASFLVFTYQPLVENVALGQSNIIILFFLTLSVNAMMSSRFKQAAILVACAALIKPQYAVLFLFFALKRLYKPFILSIVFYVMANLVSVIHVGWEFLPDFYYPGLVNAGRLALDAAVWEKNYSLFSALCKLSSGEMINFLRFINAFLFVCAFAIVIFLFRSNLKRDLIPFEFSWFVSLILVFMPLLEEHYLVVLYLPIFLLFSRMNHWSQKVQCIFIIGFLMVALRYSFERFEFLQLGFPSIVTNGKLYGTLLIMLALLLCHKRLGQDIPLDPAVGLMQDQRLISAMPPRKC